MRRLLRSLARPLLARLAPSTPELRRLLDRARVEEVAGGFNLAEGPAWHRDGYLLFTDIPSDRIMRWHPRDGLSVYRQPSRHANGLALDRHGRLFACEHGARRVSRTEADGRVVTAAGRFRGKRLNSPNDLALAADGSLYFTDPPYGLPGQSTGKELEFDGVFRLSPGGELTLLAEDFERPNGIALSSDERTIYVADTARMHVRAFDLGGDGSISNGRVFAELRPWVRGVYGAPDGVKVDAEGRVYVAGPGGVWVFTDGGRRLGVIPTPQAPTNCGFGDADGRALYITAGTSLYRIRLRAAGRQ